ncbi:ADAM 17-like protease [Physella acuta]|uniref:ADAM 17-like protease n=1 Tax=Physella acuta TaxID=109671 RepID=UPI0027DBE391|nr:ADAM 17-like protease [Physella acuta]
MKTFHLLCLFSCVTPSFSTLHSRFSFFEILTPSDITLRTKRDSDSRIEKKHLQFSALGRAFNIHLTPGSPVVHGDLEVKLVDPGGRELKVPVGTDHFYVGTVEGLSGSEVDASYAGGVWSAHIETPYDVYFIEPVANYDRVGGKKNMIIYRKSDVRVFNASSNSGRPFCMTNGSEQIVRRTNDPRPVQNVSWSRFPDLPPAEPDHRKNQTSPDSVNATERLKARRRLRSHYPNTCDMLVVVDAVTYKGLCNGSVHMCASKVVYWMQMVDRIYKSSQFGAFSGMRVKVKAIRIMKEFTKTNGSIDFNMGTEHQLYSHQLLESLSRVSCLGEYCLVHLITQRDIGPGVMGQATIANVPKEGEEGEEFWHQGICATCHNMAFSKVYTDGNFVSDSMYLVILTHEIAHGWGAQHDHWDQECSPDDMQGGKYIMWDSYNGAVGVNNLRFSPCTSRMVEEVLQHKAHLCLLPEHAVDSMCGNGVVEYAEECDDGMDPNSKCCWPNCRLKEGAICSPLNYPCCSDACHVAPVSKTCYGGQNVTCHETSYCDGTSYRTCPLGPPQADGSPCANRGTCYQGTCIGFCESQGLASHPVRHLVPCDCDSTSPCHLCCSDKSTDICFPFMDYFEDGKPCQDGTCLNGMCVGGLHSSRKLQLPGPPSLMFIHRYLFFLTFGVSTFFFVVCIGFHLMMKSAGENPYKEPEPELPRIIEAHYVWVEPEKVEETVETLTRSSTSV